MPSPALRYRKTNMFVRGSYRRADVLAVSVLFLMVVGIFGYVTHLTVSDQVTDYDEHLEFAQSMVESGNVELPHFLYHALVILAHKSLSTQDFHTSETLVIVLGHLLLSLVVYVIFRSGFSESTSSPGALVSIVMTLSVMLVSPVTLFTLGRHNLYFGYIYPANVYHNPTIILLKPLALLLFFFAAKVFTRQSYGKGFRFVAILVVLTILSSLTKPNYIICLLPGAVLFAGYRGFRNQVVDWKCLILGIIVPAVAILGWQYYFTYTASSETLKSSQIILAPLKVVAHYSSGLFPKFILSMAFPLCVYGAYFRKAVHNIELNLSWGIFLIGAFYTYFLAEGGSRMYSGNFWWSGQITLFILFVMSTRFFILQEIRALTGRRLRRFSNAFVLCTLSFGMHLVSGVFWFALHLRGFKFVVHWR